MAYWWHEKFGIGAMAVKDVHSFYNPYDSIGSDARRWLKANFHTHGGVERKEFCGALPIRDVVDAYAKAGYDVLAMTNHNAYVPYMEKRDGISLIDGIEYTYNALDMCFIGTTHFETSYQKAVRLANQQDCYWTPELLEMVAGHPSIKIANFWNMEHQELVDKARQWGAFVLLCHPNRARQSYWTLELLEKLTGYVGIEILNTDVCLSGGSNGLRDKWDQLLTRGKVVYGFGNDDFHHWHNLGRAFNMVCAKSTGFADIKEAVEAGRFYASTGLRLERFSFENGKIAVKAKLPIPQEGDAFDYRFVGAEGKVLHQITASDAEYAVAPSERYVRVEATGENGSKMYLQPVFNRRYFKGMVL